MKLEAFQRVQELESQLQDTEQPSVQMGSPGGEHTLLWLNHPVLEEGLEWGASMAPRLGNNPRPGSGLSMSEY